MFVEHVVVVVMVVVVVIALAPVKLVQIDFPLLSAVVIVSFCCRLSC